MTNKLKFSLIKNAMRFSMECNAQVLLFIKYKGNPTIYSSIEDYIYHLHKTLQGKKYIQNYSNKDYENFLKKEVNDARKQQRLKNRLNRLNRVAQGQTGTKTTKTTKNVTKTKRFIVKKRKNSTNKNKNQPEHHDQVSILIDESLEQTENDRKDDNKYTHFTNLYNNTNNTKKSHKTNKPSSNVDYLLEKVNKIIPNTEVPAHILESINKIFSDKSNINNKQPDNERTISVVNVDDNGNTDSNQRDIFNINKESNTRSRKEGRKYEKNPIIEQTIKTQKKNTKISKNNKNSKNTKNSKNQIKTINRINSIHSMNSIHSINNIDSVSNIIPNNQKNPKKKVEDQEKTIKKSKKSLNSKEFENILTKTKHKNRLTNKEHLIDNIDEKELSLSPNKLLNHKRTRLDSVDKNNNLSLAWNSFPPIPYPYFNYPNIDQQSISAADFNNLKPSEMVYLGHQFLKTPGNNIPLLNTMPLFSPLRPDQNALLYYGFPQIQNDINKN